MELALTLDSLQEQANYKYEHEEKRIVGIMLVRYDISLTRNLINDCYRYWHYNTGKTLDIFWAGYGAYLYEEDQTETKVIMDFPRNDDRAYFDLEAFIGIKDALNSKLKRRYKDRLQFVLLNFSDGKIRFKDAIQIDLEENLDDNYGNHSRNHRMDYG